MTLFHLRKNMINIYGKSYKQMQYAIAKWMNDSLKFIKTL